MASLSRTMGTPTNAYKGTVSVWVKRCALTGNLGIFNGNADVSNATDAYFNLDGTLSFYTNSGGTVDLKTTREFRDPAAWYHLVYAWDTTQGSSTNRLKLYVNGVQETIFSPATYPGSSQILQTNISGNTFNVGVVQGGTGFDGYMAHFHFIDGLQYAASDFGSTDATSGIWIPNSAPSVTYGDNGLFLKFGSGALTTDSSGNSNTMSQSGTILATKDNAIDNYCTWNSVGNNRMDGATIYAVTFSNGNTTATNGDGSYYSSSGATMGVQKGKWYAEAKCSAVGGPEAYFGLIADDDYGIIADTYTYQQNGNVNGSAYGNTYTTGDIISLAFDGDNGTLWFGKNGTWENSATEAEIEAGTDTNAAVTSMDMTKFYLLGQKGYNSGVWQLNTGNGYFGTTAITSAGTNAGSGLFEYDVPSGYYALNTINLATYG